jgi:hypothetical protein
LWAQGRWFKPNNLQYHNPSPLYRRGWS